MSIARDALAIAVALRYDASSVQQLRAEYSRLALEIATSSDGGSDITSATVNGQSFSKAVSMTKGDRLELLKRALWHIDQNNFRSQSKTLYSGGYLS